MKAERKILVSIGLISLLLIGATIYNSINVTSIRTISGSTDDSYTKIRCGDGNIYEATFANLVTALALGTEVILPPCSITITSTLAIASHTVLRGAGSDLTILSLGVDDDLMTLNAKHNIRIEGIMFDINAGFGGYNSAIDITTVNSYNITIRDCSFIDGAKSFIDCEEYTKNIVVDTCRFVGITGGAGVYPAGVWLSGEHCTVRNSWFEDTYACGVVIESNAPPVSHGHLIDGNYFTGRMGIGISMEGGGDSGECTLVNNRMWDMNSTAYQPFGSYSDGIIVSNDSFASHNWIHNMHYAGIRISGNNTVISENEIDGVQHYDGIRVSSSFINHDICIQGNIIKNINANGIKFAGGLKTNNCTIANNFISFCDTGIEEPAGCLWNIIIGNNVHDCTTDINSDGTSTVCEHNIGTVS